MGYSVPSPVCWQVEGPAEVSGAPKNSYNGSSSPHSAGSQIWLQTLAIPISLGFLFSQLRGWAPLSRAWGRGATSSLRLHITAFCQEIKGTGPPGGINH